MTTQSDHDARTPEERLLSKKRLGSFYLDDVRALIAERDNALRLAGSDYEECATERDIARGRAEAAEAEVQRLREGLREQGEPIMDERFRDRLLRHVLSNEEVGQLVDAIESRERRARALLADSPVGADEWFIPEGDRVCGVVHRDARATCMKRRGHDGPHATPQGTWIDGPWCEYPPLRGGAK